MKLFICGVLASSVFCHIGVSQVPALDPKMSCITQLHIPPFGPIAKIAKVDGTVRAAITIGQAGEVRTIKVEGPDPNLEREVRIYLTSSDYSPKCIGATVTVLFTFKREGPARHDLGHTTVLFRPPNHFTLISNPILPSLDPGRPLSPQGN
jgi:hypothetical protein